MKKITLFVLLAFFNYAQTSYAQADNRDVVTTYALPIYSKEYDDQRDPFADAKAAISLAQKTQRNILIKVGGNWCAWCHKMDEFLLSHPKIYQMLHNHYVVLKVNVSDSNENSEFMKAFPPVLGYPHIYITNNQGRVLLSKDTAELLLNLEYSSEQWLSFLKKWQRKTLDTKVKVVSEVIN